MANWSDLHHDLLIRIARRVSLIEDFVAFGGVCQSWRLAATKQNFTTKSFAQVPWLMLANDNDDDVNNSPPDREFYSVLQNRSFKIAFPESIGKRCFSSQGWILTVGKDEEVNLLHPLSRSQIRLPHLRTFSYLQSRPELISDIYTNFIRKVVLSASPSCTSDYVVMIIYTDFVPKLAFYRAGDDEWTTIDTCFCMYMDVIYCRNKFYALDSEGRVLICDVNGSNPTTAELVTVLPVGFIDFIEMLYLVESSSGNLLIVSRDGVEADEDGKYGATRFQVFEMNESDRKWKEVNNIGDQALFLGDNSSFSIDVSGFGFSLCKPNCIYFTDDCSVSYHEYDGVVTVEGGTDMGVYNLLDGTIVPHFKGESYSRIAPPLWVIPTF